MKDENDKVKKEGDTIVDEKLAVTLERIAANPESFYTGELADDILADLADVKSIIVEKDFEKDSGFTCTLHVVLMSCLSNPIQVHSKHNQAPAFRVRRQRFLFFKSTIKWANLAVDAEHVRNVLSLLLLLRQQPK